MRYTHNPWSHNVSSTISRSKRQRSRPHGWFAVFVVSTPLLPPYLTESLHMWHTYNTSGGDMSCTRFCHLCALWLHAYLTGLWWLRGAAAIRSLDLLVSYQLTFHLDVLFESLNEKSMRQICITKLVHHWFREWLELEACHLRWL